MTAQFILFPLLLLHLFFPSALLAIETQWVTAEGIASMEDAPKNEARQNAIAKARRNAVEEVVGVKILSETMLLNSSIAADIVKAIPQGRVVDEQILEEKVITITPQNNKSPYVSYKVKMKVKVVKEMGTSDPYFKLRVSLNRNVFKEGDEVEIKVTPTKDCYLTVFNQLEDETIIKLLPNQYKTKNFIPANDTFIFPDEEDKKKGLKLVATLSKGKLELTESFYFLATKQPLSFAPDKFLEGIFDQYNGKSALLKDLMQELITIPANERAESYIVYQINKQ